MLPVPSTFLGGVILPAALKGYPPTPKLFTKLVNQFFIGWPRSQRLRGAQQQQGHRGPQKSSQMRFLLGVGWVPLLGEITRVVAGLQAEVFLENARPPVGAMLYSWSFSSGLADQPL